MNILYLVDYSRNWQINPRDIEVAIFHKPKEILQFILQFSHDKSFSVVRINKYENGKLIPQQVALNRGRFELEEIPQDKEEE